MTWLSRLLPRSPRLPRLADYNHRTRQGQRRRRMATLENLEDRTLLSNVTTAIVAHELYITTSSLPSNIAPPPGTPGTPQSVSFSITENNATGQITLVGTPAPQANPHLPPLNTTQINGNPVGLSWTSTQAIQSLYITLPGDHTITDYLTITSTGTGKGTLQSVVIVAPGVPSPSPTSPDYGLNLNLSVFGASATSPFTVSGAFSLYDAPTTTAAGATPTFPVVPTTLKGVFTAPNAPAGYVFPTTGSPAVPSNNLGGNLTASVTYSSLGSLYVEQDGCCQASVRLDHDAVAGSLTVEEGTANGDIISLTNSTAGATTLIQGYGPNSNPATNTGSGDLVNVQDDPVPPLPGVAATTGILDLAITQLGVGGGQNILVGTVSPVEVGLTGFGISATQDDQLTSIQANGYNNTIQIESITVYGHLGNSFSPAGPPSIVTSQGSGGSDLTVIDSSSVWGNISASQGAGGSDTIYLGADSAGYTTPGVGGLLIPSYGLVTVSQGSGGGDTVLLSSAGSEYDALNVFNNLVIKQGNGGGDTTTVDSTDVVTGNIIIVQGNGAYDAVYVTASTAGYTTQSGPILKDHGGLLAIIQGNGYADLVEITSSGYEGDFGSTFNNVFILQGTSSPAPADCSEDVGDTVIIDQTTIASNLWIFQNATLAKAPTGVTVASIDMDHQPPVIIDGSGLGYNAVLIGTGVALPPTLLPGTILPGFTPVYSPGEVYVGGKTYIYQGGTGNTDLLGGQDFAGPYVDLPADFETGYLDIWTGAGGGGSVTATNTVVLYGSFLGNDYVINGGGAGNTYVGLGGNSDNGYPDLVYGPGYSG